jgi:hypothetical protein
MRCLVHSHVSEGREKIWKEILNVGGDGQAITSSHTSIPSVSSDVAFQTAEAQRTVFAALCRDCGFEGESGTGRGTEMGYERGLFTEYGYGAEQGARWSGRHGSIPDHDATVHRNFARYALAPSAVNTA